MSTGWICLHRGLLEWEWYNDINASRLFIHCLLRANHKPKKWRGIDIQRGQFWTSLPTLQQETGLSASQLRTSITKLKSTGELADKSQATGRMITVCRYEKYQDNDRPVSRPVTGQSQTSDRPVTANNNDNNENHENNENKLKECRADFTDCLEHLKTVTGRGFKVSPDLTARLKDYSVSEIKQVIEYKAREWMASDMQKYLRPQTLFKRSNFEGYLIDAQQMVPTEKQAVSAQDGRRVNSINNLMNMFEQNEGIAHGQQNQLSADNAQNI